MIWFTADHHFNHANIIRYLNRPFTSVHHMNQALVALWNEAVGPEDTVYHLGDLTLGNSIHFVKELKGRLKVVPGGHDRGWLGHNWGSRVVTASGWGVEILPSLYTLELPAPEGGRPLVIVLCHYPMLSWDRSHYGSTHLHGHTHGTVPDGPSSDTLLPPDQHQGLRMDVGVDCHDFRPVSLAEILRTGQNVGTL